MGSPKRKNLTFYLVVFIFAFLILILIYRNITTSVFLKVKDRVNVVFYSKVTKFFSFSKKDVNYLLRFPSDIEVLVPGGYGKYRIGALGKLVSLEKKPELFGKVFSATTSTLVDLYFYPTKTEIYYGEPNSANFPSLGEILLSKSNANMLDRLFLVPRLFKRNPSDYKVISLNRALFNAEQFKEDSQGIFYKKTYRELGSNVQIIYTKSYSTAQLLGEIIDGEGIRVVDLSQGKTNDKQCQIITKKIDLISMNLGRYFNCQVVRGETTVSDIIFKLGNLEKDWAVK